MREGKICRETAELVSPRWALNKRDFLWRRTINPYEILIAELLLRKTTAKQVESLYVKFLYRYPSPEALSKALERDTEDTIKSLGIEHKKGIITKNCR